MAKCHITNFDSSHPFGKQKQNQQEMTDLNQKQCAAVS